MGQHSVANVPMTLPVAGCRSVQAATERLRGKRSGNWWRAAQVLPLLNIYNTEFKQRN
jgi:hypothetical protein